MKKPESSSAAPFAAPSDLEIRPADLADADALGTLWARAFPGERSAADRAGTLAGDGDTWGGIDTCRIARVGGRIAGACRVYRMTMSLFGRPVPTLGLGAVAVSPDFRRRGVGGALCRDALRVGRERGDLVSLLYPFRVDYYGRLGWALAGAFERYRFAPEELPAFSERTRARLLEPHERRSAVPELYGNLLGRRHGLLHRGPRQWEILDDPGTLVVGVEEADGLTGVALVRPGDRGRSLAVREVHVSDAAGYRAILGWLSVQRDQWRRVTFDALPGERLHQVLAHPRRPGTRDRRGLWFESAVLLRGPMLRLLDLAGLSEIFGVAAGARIELADPQLPEQAGVWVAAGSGRLERAEPDPGPGALPIRVVSGLVASGQLPGVRMPPSDFEPIMGIGDFNLLDTF